MALYMPNEIPDFDIKFIDFQRDIPEVTFIALDAEFCSVIRNFFCKGNNKGFAEEVGKRFFELKGLKVRENYKLKGALATADLSIYEDNKETLVEMKCFNDKLSLKQLELIINNKGLIGWLVSK